MSCNVTKAEGLIRWSMTRLSWPCTFWESPFLQLDRVGREHLVLDLSCRKKGDSYFVVTDRWQKFSDLEMTRSNIDFLEGCCDEFLVHGVDVEGKRLGINEDLVQLLGERVRIPVTYAGGARTLVRKSCSWILVDQIMKICQSSLAVLKPPFITTKT